MRKPYSLFFYGEPDSESRTLSGFALDADGSEVLLHNLFCDGKPQTRPVRLCRKEGVEYLLTKLVITSYSIHYTKLYDTSFHASAKITCVPHIEKFLEKKPQECEAFVIRRSFDGTATVEIPQKNSVARRILFVKGKPVASDSPCPPTFTRKNDLTIVTFDTDERYEIPDALIFGG